MASSGAKTTLSALHTDKEKAGGIGANGYVVFAGGSSLSTYEYTVEAYNMASSGAKTTLSNLKAVNNCMATANVNNYIIFAGGGQDASSSAYYDTVEAYDMASSGTKQTLSPLKAAKRYLVGAGANNYAVFAGGGIYRYDEAVNEVEAYYLGA
jgi:hypothetical protein